MSERALGYLLITAGILVILYSAMSVISVFTKKSLPFEVFQLSGISIDLGGTVGSDLSAEEKAALESGNVNTKAELISPEVLNTPLNYAAHIMFMAFIASVGLKLASVGAMLVRPIKIKLREEKGLSSK